MENSEEIRNYSRKDVESNCKYLAKFKDSEHIKPHNLWDIPKKTHNNEVYENGELTE